MYSGVKESEVDEVSDQSTRLLIPSSVSTALVVDEALLKSSSPSQNKTQLHQLK
jgi:hypothetical protein